MGIVVRNHIRFGSAGRSAALAASVGALLLFPAVTLCAADNKIQFGNKTPASASLPATAPKGNSTGFSFDGMQTKSSLSPAVDPNALLPNLPNSNERQKWIELYVDRQQNWMFVDPKEMTGKTSAKEVFGVTGFDAENKQDKKTIEKYWERARNESRKNDTNQVGDAESEKRREDEKTPNQSGGWNQPDGASVEPLGGGAGSGGLRSPGAGPSKFGGIGRLPTFGDGFGGFNGGTRNGFGLAAPNPEFQNKMLDAANRPSVLSGPFDPINLKVDSTVREMNPVMGRTIPSAAAGPAGPSAADPGRGLAMPSLPTGNGLDGFGSRLSDPSSSIFAPSVAPASSSINAPQRPAILEFPKRVF